MDLKPVHVLLVEDDRNHAELIQRAFEQHPDEFHLTLAGTLKEAKSALLESVPDILISDLLLPDGRGTELLPPSRQERKFPLVLITGYGDENAAVEAMRSGALDYVAKSPEALLALPRTAQRVLREWDHIVRRRQIQEALRESEEKLRLITDALPALISYVDTERRFRFNNQTYQRWFGIPAEDIHGKRMKDLLGADMYLTVQPQIELALAGEPTKFETRFKYPDGITRDVSISFVPHFGIQREVKGFIALVTDISDLKKAEQAMIHSERLKAVGELSSGVSHNFNNMLQVVLGNALVAQTNLELGDLGDVRTNLDEILETARFASQTVKRLQYFAGNRTRSIASGVVDLSDVAREAIEMSRIWWKTEPEKAGITIDMVSTLRRGCKVVGRESELFEVIINLIKNAAEALTGGGEIEIDTYTDDTRVILSVRDNGTGITEESLGRLFEPFFTTKGFPNTGMGLASVHGIVRNHDGRTLVESVEGQGTTFLVVLPLAPKGAELALRESESGALEQEKTILLVDDMLPVLNTMRSGLDQYGHTVFAATNGADALKIVGEHHVDLVICDLGMPGMNGWQVGKAIKELFDKQGTVKPPFIVLTGWSDQVSEEAKIAESGVQAIVEKPVDMKDLMRLIRQHTSAD
jgi:two-component system cell cycle sensor histidine kinase/response regulator CckA